MKIIYRKPIDGKLTGQVIRLSNGWWVTTYQERRNSYPLIVSKDNGATWAVLCQAYTGDNTDYIMSIQALFADGVNVFVIGEYGDINNNDRIWTNYINATTISSSTNIYSSRNAGSVNSWLSVSKVKYLHGRYQYLFTDLSYDEFGFSTRYKSHISRADNLPPSSGSTLLSSTNSAVMTGDFDVISFADGQEWIFYGSSNTLMLRRRLTANGTFQAAQLLQTLTSNYRIRRLHVIEFNGATYIFYSWMAEDNSRVGLSYITTTNGTTFTAVQNIFDIEPIHQGQHLDFDVLSGDKIVLFIALPMVGTRVALIVKVDASTFKAQIIDMGIPDKNAFLRAIRAVGVQDKEYIFSVDLADGTNILGVKLEVDGIKRFSGTSWDSIEQGYRYGTSWQENNGKRFNGSTWQNID